MVVPIILLSMSLALLLVWVAASIRSKETDVERLRSALERLASIEAFGLAGAISMHSAAGKEISARIEYARKALNIEEGN